MKSMADHPVEEASKDKKRILKVLGEFSKASGDETVEEALIKDKDKTDLIEIIFWDVLDKLSPGGDIPDSDEYTGPRARRRQAHRMKLTKPEYQKEAEKYLRPDLKKKKYRQLHTLTQYPDIVEEYLPEYVSGKDHPKIKKGRSLKKAAAEKTLEELLGKAKEEGKKKGRPEIF